ncbi:hypothetical protein [Planococcus sp. CAU13]|uniref:hypothetical protein n=1 Tax=Planococcus sp. CAU13 TaxID=1541197 RepID=UPI00052FFA8D|nr:hypothetical protein [Planococcus sp. CAU13]
MYVHVESEMEKKLFKKTFLETTREYEFKYNELYGEEERFLLLKRPVIKLIQETSEYEEQLKKNVIGTVEVNPFVSGGHSIVQEYVDMNLSLHPEILGREHETFEVGKLCIEERYQSRGYFRNVMVILYEHSERTMTKQYLGTLVLPLFSMMIEQYGDAVQQIGEPDKDKVPGIPVLIDAEKMKKNKDFMRLVERYLGILA